MSKSKFALGAVVGAVAGVVAGVLTAPKSGKETRADIKMKADELKTEASKKADGLKKQADKATKDAKATATDYRGRAERAYASAKKEFKEEAKK